MEVIKTRTMDNKRFRESVECNSYEDLERVLIEKHDMSGMCFLPFKSYDYVSTFFDDILALEKISLTDMYIKFLAYKKKIGLKSNSNRQQDYYKLRGYSVDEADVLIKEIQTKTSNTNKELRIKNSVETKRKSGSYSVKSQGRGRAFYRNKGLSEEEIERKIKLRNKKWSASMQKAIENITRRLTANGTNSHQNTSSLEEYVHERLDGNWDTQYVLTGGSRNWVYDFVNHDSKLILEVNGDFWHANPEMYAEDWINPITKVTAKEKWNYDEEKTQYAESKGYKVITIWEKNIKELRLQESGEQEYYDKINDYSN